MIRLALVLLSVPFASTTESSKAIKDWRASGTVALKDWRAGAVRLMGYVDEGLAGPSMGSRSLAGKEGASKERLHGQ